MGVRGRKRAKKRRGEMEGKIEKHTLSCGQDIEREEHTNTSTRSLRECSNLEYTQKTHRHHAVCFAIPVLSLFSGKCYHTYIYTYVYHYTNTI